MQSQIGYYSFFDGVYLCMCVCVGVCVVWGWGWVGGWEGVKITTSFLAIVGIRFSIPVQRTCTIKPLRRHICVPVSNQDLVYRRHSLFLVR